MNQYVFEFPGLVTATLTLSIAAAIAWLMLRWLNSSSHRLHRLVWLAVLVNGIILTRYSLDLPILTSAPDQSTWHLSTSDETSVRGYPPTSELFVTEGTEIERSTVLDQEAGAVPTIASTGEPHSPDQMAAESALSKAVAAGTSSTSRISSMIQSLRQSATNWLPSIIWVWWLGVVITLSLLLVRYIRFCRRVYQAEPAREAWTKDVHLICEQQGIRPVPLLTHPGLGPALTVTPWGARIVVPGDFWNHLSVEQRHAILQHELAHYQRADVWKSLFVTILAVPHWFNPLCWLAVRRFNDAAEWACDEAVGQDNELERTGFARALLSLSTGNNRFLIGASALGSSDLPARVQRLLGAKTDDTVLRRLILGLLIGFIVLLGWVNLRLVSASGWNSPAINANPAAGIQDLQEPQEEPDKRIEEFGARLAASDDPLAKKLAEAIKTEAGRVAVANHVSGIQDQMQQDAARSAVPEYFSNHLASDEAVRNLGVEVNTASSDIESIAKALAGLRSRMREESEAERMLVRLLDHENSPGVLYFSQFREQMRPGQRMIMQRLGQFLAEDGNGRFVVRESAKDELVRNLEQFDEIEKQKAWVASELKNWAEEIEPVDDLHREIIKRLSRSDAATRVLALYFGQEDVQQRLESYFQYLEYIFVDGPDGLTVADDRREEVLRGMEESRKQTEKVELLRDSILRIADLIDEDHGEAEKLVKRFASSDFGISVLVRDFNVGSTSPTSIVDQIKNSVLEEVDGRLAVRSESEPQVVEYVREMMRRNRRVRRQTRFLNDQIEQLENGQLRTICESMVGRVILLEKIRAHVESRRFDAWPVWLNEHFESSGDGYLIRDDSRALVEEILQQTQQIAEELQKDDF